MGSMDRRGLLDGALRAAQAALRPAGGGEERAGPRGGEDQQAGESAAGEGGVGRAAKQPQAVPGPSLQQQIVGVGRSLDRSLQEEIQMSKELARLPFVNKECMQAISQYEAQYGEVIVNGKRYYDELKEEEMLSPRKVGLILLIHCRLLHLFSREYTSGGDGYVHCYTILFSFSLFLLLLNLFV